MRTSTTNLSYTASSPAPSLQFDPRPWTRPVLTHLESGGNREDFAAANPGFTHWHFAQVVRHILEMVDNAEAVEHERLIKERNKQRTNDLRQRHPNHGRKWSKPERKEVGELFCRGTEIEELAKRFGRTEGGIAKELEKQHLYDCATNAKLIPANYLPDPDVVTNEAA